MHCIYSKRSGGSCNLSYLILLEMIMLEPYALSQSPGSSLGGQDTPIIEYTTCLPGHPGTKAIFYLT